MRKQIPVFAVLLSVFSLVVVATALRPEVTAQTVAAVAAAKPGGGSTSYVGPVTSVVFDFDSSGNQLLFRSDDYNGVGQATYTSFKGKGANAGFVNSAIHSDGHWQLDMNEQSGRSLWVTPNQAIDNSQPAAPPAGYYAIQKAYSICRDESDNPVPFPNLVNGSSNCSLAVNFFFADTLYKLIVRPDMLAGTVCPSGGCPPTGLARVTCNAVSNNQCVNWTITPNTDAPFVGVSNLYSYTGPRGTPWVFSGQYYNTFRIDASH